MCEIFPTRGYQRVSISQTQHRDRKHIRSFGEDSKDCWSFLGDSPGPVPWPDARFWVGFPKGWVCLWGMGLGGLTSLELQRLFEQLKIDISLTLISLLTSIREYQEFFSLVVKCESWIVLNFLSAFLHENRVP